MLRKLPLKVQQISEGKKLSAANTQDLQLDTFKILGTWESCPQQLVGQFRASRPAPRGSVRAILSCLQQVTRQLTD